MSTDVQGMLVRIEATTQQLRQELARAESAVGKTSQRIDGDLGRVDAAFDRLEESAAQAGSVVDSALTGITAATVASVAGLGALIATTAAAGKELTSLSCLANASTAEFQRMAAGARSVGVDQGKLADVLKDVNDRVGEFASTGGGEMKDFFEQIAPKVGVTVQQFQKLSGPQALQLYYDSLEKAGLNQQEMTFYMEAMADEATALIPLLANGGKGFQEMGDRAERLGVVLSDLELSQLAELSKIAGEAGMAWEGVTNQLVAGLQPAISALVESLDGEGFSAAAQDMGDGIRFVIDNLDALVIAVGSLGAGRLAIRFVEGVQAISGYVQSVRQATEAERIHTQAVQVSALEQVRRAEGELNAARIQAISTRGTVEHTAALSRQRQAKLDLAVANQAYTAAQTAANAVTGTATALLRGALGLFGGPVGLVTMIGTAAAGWLLFADNSDKARQATLDLTQPVEALRREIEALTLAQANSRLLQLEEGQKALRGELEDTTEALAAQVVQYDYWGNRFTVGQREAGAAWAEFMAAVNRGDDIGQAAIALADATGASAEMRAEIISTAAEMETQRGQIDQNAAAQVMLEGHMRSLTDATRENTAATGENTGSKGGNTDAAQKYLEQLQKQLNAMRDKTALQAAERFLTENSITAESELGQQILATATAKDRQREADTAATAARKSSTKAVKDEAKELQSLLDKLLPAEAAQREHIETAEALDKALLDGRITLERYTAAMSAAWAAQNKGEWEKQAKEQEELNRELKASNDEFERLEDQLEPVRAAGKRLSEQQKILRAEYERGEISLDRYNELLGKAQGEYQKTASASSQWAQLTESAHERVDAAFANMWLNIDQGFESFADGLKQGFKQLLAELAHAAITRPITISFMNSLLGTNKAGGIGEVWGGVGGDSGGFGLSDAFGLVKNGFSIANSGFGQAIGAGWSGGQGFFGGLQGAFSSGSSYLGSLLSGGSTATTTLANGTVQFLPGGSAATVDLIGNTVSQGGNVVGTASGMTTGATTWGSAASGLGAILGGVGGAFQGYQKAGLKGAVAGGLGGWGGATLGTIAGAAVAAAVSGTAMGAALGSVIPGIGTAIGAMLGAAFGSSLFGGDWVTKHSGVAVGAKEGQFQGFNYEYMEKKGGLFGSDKSKYKYADMDATLEKQLSKRFDSVVETVPGLFEKLGYDIAEGALDGINVGMRHIALSGSPEKQQEQLEKGLAKWFGKVGNVSTAALGGALVSGFSESIVEATSKALGESLRQAGLMLSEKQLAQLDGLSGEKLVKKLSAMSVGGNRVGQATAAAVANTVDQARAAALEALTTLDVGLAESLRGKKGRQLDKELAKLTGFGKNAYETLSELVAKLDTVNQTFETLNLTLYDGSLAGAKMAEDLVAAAGGLEEFTKKTASYYDKFFSETEKAEDSLEAVIRQFADANLVLPANHRQFRAVVESIDASTAAGRELFNTMMNLAEGADAAYGAFATLRQGLLDAVHAEQARVEGLISAAQQAVMEAYGRQSSELSAVISKWDRFSDSLKKFRADLDATILATASPQKQLEVLRKEFGALLAKAKLGDEQALEALPGTGTALAAAALAGSSSREDYVRELARIRAGAAEAEAAVGRQKSVAEQQLAALNAQMEELKLITSALPTFEEAVKALLKARIDGAEAISEAEKVALTAEIDWLSRQIGKGLADQNMSAVASILSLGFGALDSSVDGLLDAAELTKALEGVAGPDEVAAIISAMDANADGMISAAEAGNLQLGKILEDLLGGIASQDSSAVVSALRSGFASLDTNVDGLLTAAELTTALGPLAKGVDIAMVVAGIDSNGDGFISAIELGSSREVMAINAVEAAIRAQAAQVGGGITENLGDAGKDVTLAEFKKAVQTAAAAKGISASVANDSFVSSLFNQMDTNRNGKIRQGGAKNEYSQVAVENAIADLLKAQQTPTTPGSTTPPAKYTYDKARVADSLEAAIDAALGVSGFSPQSYLAKNPDVAGSWPGLANTAKGSYNNDPNLYGAWHYWNFGRKENRQFFTGGYTGPGGMFEEAGTVHKGEVVWNQFDVARFGGWQNVEALRLGGPLLDIPNLQLPNGRPQLNVAMPRRSGDGMTASLLAELGQLRATVEQQGYALVSMADNLADIKKSNRHLRDWARTGVPVQENVA